MKSRAAILALLVALSVVYLPEFWVLMCVIVDFYTPWVLFESKLYDVYHNFLVGQLTEKAPIALPELTAGEATYDAVYKASKGFTFPVVIRNLLGNTTAVQNWGNPDWWIEHYGNEELLCGALSEVEGDECTVRGFFNAIKKGRPFYVSGASQIFEKHPELHEMIDNDAIRKMEPAGRIATQIFMGIPGTGSDVHCAIGVNVFRQITGHKKWWFIPPSETKYLKPSWNTNGFSAHTLTKIGKGKEEPSPWFNKLVRYTTTLHPGDVLVNPPWFWHGIENLGEIGSSEVIIGSPVRYIQSVSREAAFKSNFFYSAHTIMFFAVKNGLSFLRPGFKMNLQGDIDKNRKQRNAEFEDDHKVKKREAEQPQMIDPFEQADN